MTTANGATMPTVGQMRRTAKEGARGTPFMPWEHVRMFGAYGDGGIFDTPWQVKDLERMLSQDGNATKGERLLRQAIKSAPWEVRAAPGDRGEAAYIRETMGRQLGPLIKRCTMAFSRRKTFHEIEWALDGSITDVALRPILSCDQQWTDDGKPNGFRQRVPYQHPHQDPQRPGTVRIDEPRSFVYVHGRDTDPHRGVSDLEVTLNLFEKRNKLTFLLLSFLEQQTVPRIAALGQSLTDAENNADRLAETTGGGIIPMQAPSEPGAKLFEVIESSGKGASEFLTTLRWLEEQQDNSILAGFMGLTSQAAQGRGSHAMSTDFRDLFQANQQEKADELGDQVAEGVLRKACVLRFGPDAKTPSLHVGPISKDAAGTALEMLQSTTTAATVNIPDGVVDLLWTQSADLLGLDVDQVREAVEGWREQQEADRAQMQPDPTDGDPEQQTVATELAHAIDDTHALVTAAQAGVDPADFLG